MRGRAAVALELADYRRQVAELYGEVRRAGGGPVAWKLWRKARDEIFGNHPQSALDPERRAAFIGLEYFDYDPRFAVEGAIEPADPLVLDMPHSDQGTTRFERIGTVRFSVDGTESALDVFWLDAYGGGLFLPFGDDTNADTTYGGGRYLLDTVKGADLGSAGHGRLILDFNFAYHPSCVHSDRWSCPLAPPGNRLAIAVTAGERLSGA